MITHKIIPSVDYISWNFKTLNLIYILISLRLIYQLLTYPCFPD